MAGNDSQKNKDKDSSKDLEDEKKTSESKEEEFDEEGFMEYLQMLKSTGEEVPKKPTETQIEELKAAFGQWDEDGRPKPKMPKPKKAAASIEKVYRRKVYDKLKISWITSDGDHIGLKETNIYGTMDLDGETVSDESVVVGTNKEWTKDWSDKLGKEIMEKAFKTCVKPTFYFVEGGVKIGIKNPRKNFLGDFDQIMSDASEGKAF